MEIYDDPKSFLSLYFNDHYNMQYFVPLTDEAQLEDFDDDLKHRKYVCEALVGDDTPTKAIKFKVSDEYIDTLEIPYQPEVYHNLFTKTVDQSAKIEPIMRELVEHLANPTIASLIEIKSFFKCVSITREGEEIKIFDNSKDFLQSRLSEFQKLKKELLDSGEYLYRRDSEGKLVPHPTDIVQSGELGDCFALSVLISLAKKDPEFIKNELITVKDDKVIVALYEYETSDKEVQKQDEGSKEKISYRRKIVKPLREHPYTLTMNEIEEWRIHGHRARWVDAVELAYAKLRKDCGYLGSSRRKQVESDLHSYLHGGFEEEAMVVLTGKKAIGASIERKDSDNDTATNISEKLPADKKYGFYCRKILNKIQKHLIGKGGPRGLVNASFEKISSPSVSPKAVYETLKSVFADERDERYSYFEKQITSKCRYLNVWQITYELNRKEPKKYDIIGSIESFVDKIKTENDTFIKSPTYDYLLKKYIAPKLIDCSYLGNAWQTKTGVISYHAYTVLDCFEDKETGYWYVTLQNPWGDPAKIDYTKSKRFPKLATPPTTNLYTESAFNMELGHFCKHLKSLSYDNNEKGDSTK